MVIVSMHLLIPMTSAFAGGFNGTGAVRCERRSCGEPIMSHVVSLKHTLLGYPHALVSVGANNQLYTGTPEENLTGLQIQLCNNESSRVLHGSRH